MSAVSDRGRDPFAGRIPITIITGFLGAGKSTLLGKLLRHPDMHRAAVIVNEFGEVGIDHALLSGSTESMTLLPNGCLCCTVRTDLQETLREMFIQRRAGEIIDFDRVFIETSGLADPAPIMHSLVSDHMLATQYRLDGVVTLVDAINGSSSLVEMPEAVKQVAVADRLVITKTDLAQDPAIKALEQSLAQLNPQADQMRVVRGEIEPRELSNIGLARGEADLPAIERWLGRVSNASTDEGTYLGSRVPRATHLAAVRSFVLWFDQPFTWQSFTTIVQVLTSLRGPDLLRVKGLVNIVEETGPVVVQGAQHLFDEPARLENWPSEDRRSRLVFITKNLSRELVEGLFKAVGTISAPAATPKI
ncbi:MAG: GTP-binding protein [Betaproteobacteria bacterium]|nr:GTP-binding protein [Betaproteobacteria bacterium]